MAVAFLMRRMPRTYSRLAGRRPTWSYSQNGEDLVLANLLGPADGRIYIDLGCGHPVLGSDTYVLYRNGWRGLVVDGDPKHAKPFRRARPRDTFVPAILTADGREVRFSDRDQKSSASPEWHALDPPESEPVARSSVAVQALLDSKVPAGTKVGLLKVDVENLDAEILMAIDLGKLDPDAIMVEQTCFWNEDVQKRSLTRFLDEHGYGCAYHNFVNNIYIRRHTPEQRAAHDFQRYVDLAAKSDAQAAATRKTPGPKRAPGRKKAEPTS
ncbi:MAG: hypothetical protein QOC71_1929 [Thermoplasmata archaeon]|nr:hypothetical protein [Thermoplasmata archaeon]